MMIKLLLNFMYFETTNKFCRNLKLFYISRSSIFIIKLT